MIQNPILRGFAPDPSIVRVGDDYYIATSTFEWFPGIRIHHSRDLKHWRLLTHVIAQTSQLNMKGNPDSGGIWAPCLTYDNGLFYLLYTDVKSRLGAFIDSHNYLITAESIEGPWSEPIYLNSSGFDPSLFHDKDGRKWVLNMLWDHRPSRNSFGGIVLQEYSMEHRKLIGERKTIFLGTELGGTEGPHLYKRNDYYYLVVAEGGTWYAHAMTVARSKTIEGPYEVDPTNPILTASDRMDLPLQKAGHGCLVETQDGEWAMVHLVGRPVKGARCILGRETAIQRIEWTKDEWMRLEGGGKAPQLEVREFNLPETKFADLQETDHFDSEQLGPHWNTLRIAPDPSWLTLSERPGFLRMLGRESLNSLHHQSLVARRQQATRCLAETEIEFEPESYQQMAGLILYYDTKDYVYLRISRDEQLGKCLGIVRSVRGKLEEFVDDEVSLEGVSRCKLRAVILEEYATFQFAIDGGDWQSIGPKLDISHLADETNLEYGFIRFTGTFVGLCVQDLSGAQKQADFDYFRYTEKAPVLLEDVQHVDGVYYNARLGVLLDQEASAAILEKYLPGIINHPMMDILKRFTLDQLIEIPMVNINDEMIGSIIAELSSLECLSNFEMKGAGERDSNFI